jgi:hypothetical protein
MSFDLPAQARIVNTTAGTCSNTKAASEFLPYDMIAADIANV